MDSGENMFDRINELVAKQGFTLKAWDDRYGKGVWAVCTPLPYHGEEICEASSDGDLDMIAATEYVLSTKWLPVVTARSIFEALGELEGLLGTFSADALSERASLWRQAVWDALEHFRDVRHSDGDFDELPAILSRTEAHTVSADRVTWKTASQVTTDDELAMDSFPHRGCFDVHSIRAIEPGGEGRIAFKHGPVGLAVVEYDSDDDIRVVLR
ncbi:hypothetical protein CRM94_16550 [Burkholderia gladioli]|uniref:Uncharacterized protein n=2 Tax=Burkholderia gladioli TaxID=28095 RepID=A0A2A7SBK8_BURGA|nr:hypothetical protein CRM94_16550 [Burkholderia gladioli]